MQITSCNSVLSFKGSPYWMAPEVYFSPSFPSCLFTWIFYLFFLLYNCAAAHFLTCLQVVMNKNGYNLAVDIWSLGCTILEMAMAKPPWSQYEGVWKCILIENFPVETNLEMYAEIKSFDMLPLQVAAIFKIGNSKDIPEIPDFLSNDAKNFLYLCLQRDPADRPSASQLLEHPFVKEQSAGRVHINATNEPTSFSFDGRRKPVRYSRPF